jgi:hypothetical protein
VQLRLPFVETGFWYAELASNYYQDYKLDEREPLSLQLDVSRTEVYGNSWLPNKQFAFSLYAVNDRDDQSQGAAITLSSDLPAEFYIGLSAKYSRSDTALVSPFTRRGVELSGSAGFIDNDPSSIYMPSLYNDTFAEAVSFGELSLNKVLNLSAYSFKGPLSLRRERVELAYRHYAITAANGFTDVDVRQAVVGVSFDLQIMNVLPIGIALEYIYSDDETLTDKSYVQAGLLLPL